MVKKSSLRKLQKKMAALRIQAEALKSDAVEPKEPIAPSQDSSQFENSVIEDVKTGALSFPPGFNPNAKAIATKIEAAGSEIEIRLGALRWVGESENMRNFLELNPELKVGKFYAGLSLKLTDRLTVYAIAFFFPPYSSPKVLLSWMRSKFSQSEANQLPGQVKAIAPELARSIHALAKVRFAAAVDEKIVKEVERSSAKN